MRRKRPVSKGACSKYSAVYTSIGERLAVGLWQRVIEGALGFLRCELFGFFDAGEESGWIVALGQAGDGVTQVGFLDGLGKAV